MTDHLNVNEVYDVVTQKLQSKTPMLLVRLGDGEMLTMSQKNIEYVTKRQFGYVPPKKDLDYISTIVADAYIYADIIGIPTQHHIEKCGSSWANAYPYLKEIRPEVAEITTTSIDVHSELLHSGLLDKLISNQKEIVYISGRDLDEGFKRKYGTEKVTSFHVKAEQKFEADRDSSHYPKQYKECLQWIENTDVYGKLCLVGAGVLGKWYSALLKQQGGIVLELGHVFDSWAGLCTRGTWRGVNVIDETYKL
jgi:hypothetical protein